MMGILRRRSVDNFYDIVNTIEAVTQTAGGSGVGAYVDSTSIIIDRGAHNMPLSGTLGLSMTGAIANTKTVKVRMRVLDCASEDGEFAQYYESGEFEYDNTLNLALASAPIDLSGAKRYLKVGVKATFSAASTDTLAYRGFAVLETGPKLGDR